MKQLAALLLLLSAGACVAQNFGTFSVQPTLAGGLHTDWSQRVVNNGGALPSQNTIAAMETLRLGLMSAGLDTKIHSLCVFVPDSLLAATTPLIKNKGSDPWVNTNFVSDDLTIEGLKGDGSTKFLQSGVTANQANDPITRNVGLSAIVTETMGNPADVIAGYSESASTKKLLLSPSGGGISQFWNGNNSTGFLATNDWDRVGFFSCNSITNAGGNWDFSIYVASSVEKHKRIATGVVAAAPSLATSNSIVFFANTIANAPSSFSSKRLSFGAVTDGLTQTESSNLWVLVKACRDSLGGGSGNPAYNWNQKVVAFGGASTSAATQTALSNFLAGLDIDNTLYNQVAVNALVPDNVTAACVPIIWQAGNEIWTNVLFASSNLTVNGMAGVTNKYMQTGIVLSSVVIRGFSSTSAGLTLLYSNNPNTAGNHDLAVQVGGGQFTLVSVGGTALFRCWKFTGVNVDQLVAPNQATNGFFSGQRTAANAIAIYHARSDIAHHTITNATGTQTGSALTGFPMAAFAINNAGTVSFYSTSTLSYMGITSGMTQTQSSNLYLRVVALRTALGGGSP